MRRAAYETPFGVGWVAFGDGGIAEIMLPRRSPPAGAEDPSPPAEVAAVVATLEGYFRGEGDLSGRPELAERAGTTPLQRAIYRVVCEIPPGETRSYGAVARAAGRPRAARAVGAAMARNPYPPLIPCHRVVAADGSLNGYGGGLDMKAHLLATEAGSEPDRG